MSIQVPLFEKVGLKPSKTTALAEVTLGARFDVKKFVENFDALVEAAGGVEHLRGLIIDLAIRGRLGTQSPKDRTANVLLEQAARELGPDRKRRVIEGKPQPTYSLPPGWAWCEPQDLGEVSPRNEVDDESVVGFIPMTKVPTDYRQAVTCETRPWKEIKKGYTHVADGDIAVAKITPCFQNGKSCVMAGLPNGAGAGTTELLVLRPVRGVVEAKYLLLFFKSPDFISHGVGLMTGTAGQQRVPVEYFAAVSFPLPPLAEQKRIVAKVDQLMALCDDLDARQTKKREVGTRLTKSALEALTTAEGPEEFDAAWKRVVENFDVLVDRAENVAFLRSAVLGLGMNGSLTRLSRRGADSEGLPAGWSRTSLGELANFVTSGSRNWKNYYAKSGATFIRSQDIKTDALDLSSPAFVAVPNDAEGTRTRVTKDDILITITGANVGKAAHVDRDVPEAYVSQHVALVRLKQPELATWVQRWLISPSNGRGQLLGSSYGDKPGLNLSQVKGVVIDLPPPAERDRILQLMTDMLAQCDRLASRFGDAEDLAGRLVEAAVQELVVGESTS
jgi:type I restriction enzyme S subunit